MTEPAHAKSVDRLAPPSPSGPGVRRYSVAAFLTSLVLLIVMFSFVQGTPNGDIVEALVLTVVLFAGVRAVGGRARTLLIGVVLAAPTVVSKWIDHYHPGWLPPGAFLVPGCMFLGFVALHLLRFVLVAPRVTQEVLCAGISIYLLMGVLWGFGYTLIGKLVPNAFVFSVGPPRSPIGFEAAYFSFITLTTCGYGDIVPVANVARMLAMLESMAGTFYVAILIARLVSLYSSSNTSRDSRDS
jgi:hypothetical protein